MTYPSTTPAPAGWYPDPKDRRVERWFDGAGWSDHVRTTGDTPPVVPYGAGVPRSRRPGRTRKAAVPVSLLAISLALKAGVLATNLVSEAQHDARHHPEPPAVVVAPPAPTDAAAAGGAAQPPPATTQELPFRAAELEQEIVDRLAAEQGLTVTVTCPADTPMVIPGMEFLCGVVADGTWGSADVVIVPGGGWTWTYLPETSSLPTR